MASTSGSGSGSAAAAATAASSESVEFLVRRYLKLRGLHEAAEMLAQNGQEVSKAESGELSSSSSTSLDSISDAILFESFEGGVSHAYFHAYDSFRTWTCSSLDSVKSELITLCYPLFVNW
jgi:hypothetical protein